MAAIDGLLKLIAARGADALIIEEKEVPWLEKGGAQHPLSMPVFGPTMVNTFVEEIGGVNKKTYETDDGQRFVVVTRLAESGLRMRFFPVTDGGEEEAHGEPVAEDTEKAPSPEPSAPATAVAAPAEEPKKVADLSALQPLFDEVAERGASDLIVSSGQDARVRVDSVWSQLSKTTVDEGVLRGLLGEKQSKTLNDTGSVDLAVVHGVTRYRVNVFSNLTGLAAAFRVIRSNPPSLSQLNLPSSLKELVGYPNGLVLITGSAGSGKSTTLVALIEHLNQTKNHHIITLEDPVEFRFRPKKSLVHQREIGVHVPTFATGLRAALRESPDVIVVGEMRDRETTAAALTAAETGHLVLGTMHASNAMVAIDRVIDVFEAAQQKQIRYQLSVTLRATLTQALLRKKTKGRVPAYELMFVNEAIASNIRESKTHLIGNTIQTSKSAGMVRLESSLAELVKSGAVSKEEAVAVCADESLLRDLIR